MTPRSELRVRKHSDRERQNEIVIEVVRGGKVVANIYGSREGIHIACKQFGENGGFRPFTVDALSLPGVIIPMLQPGEDCPWCESSGMLEPNTQCPVCGGKNKMRVPPGRGKTEGRR